jgi:hypothetical protein
MAQITAAMIRKAKTVYVSVTFTGDDESWIAVTKLEILRQLSYIPDMQGAFEPNGDLYISATG